MYLYIVAIGWAYVILMMAVTANKFRCRRADFRVLRPAATGLVFYGCRTPADSCNVHAWPPRSTLVSQIEPIPSPIRSDLL